MPVPKRKQSKSRRDMRRANDALSVPQHVVRCEKCDAWKERHRVCTACGTYRGRVVFEIKEV
jgi:large subunit ribosomal protein L32